VPAPDVAEGIPSVTLRYWAAAKQAAGTAQEDFDADAAGSLADLLAAAVRAHPDDGAFARVLARCSFLVGGDPVGSRAHHAVLLLPGAVVEALPPFAGG
jgi:molybdopterin converting factor small subunit